MKRRRFLEGGALAAMSAFAQGRKPPNILYLHSHDTGRYLQPYGHDVPTPNLTKLAHEGVLFRRAFNAAPTCSPSRSALLTGACPHANGMLGLAHRGFSLNDYSQHLLHTLRRQSYTSTLIGLQHVARSPATIGYDRVEEIPGNRAINVGPAAARFIRNMPKAPFFLNVGFFETHREFEAPGKDEDPRYCMPPATVPDMPQSRQDMAGFKASARVLDTAVGQVLEALAAAGLAENTLVIYTTDHGIAFPAMKCNLTDHGTGVALILRGPGGFSGGRVCESMVSHLDLFPTLCDLTELPYPSWLEGRSLMPLIQGTSNEVNEEIFAEVNYHAAYEPKRSVRTGRWKYIRHFGDRHKPVLPNCDDGLSKDIWLQYGWRNRPVESEQLFDLVFDPNEVRNMAGDRASQPTLQQMRARLDGWMQRTRDPLLQGDVAAPPGAVVNDPNGVSPKERVSPA